MNMATLVPTVRVQTERFDLGAEAEKLSAGRTDVGAVATFTGICRGDENGKAGGATKGRDEFHGEGSPGKILGYYIRA